MNIFGIGPLEIVFILILVIIIFGPKDLEKAGKIRINSKAVDQLALYRY